MSILKHTKGRAAPEEEGMQAGEDTQPLRHRELARGALDKEPKGRGGSRVVSDVRPRGSVGEEILRPALEASRTMGKARPSTGSSHLRGPQTTIRWGMPGTALGAGDPTWDAGSTFRKGLYVPFNSLVEGNHEEGNAYGPRPQGPPPPAVADLQMGNVSVDVHGRRHAVLRNIFVVAGARLAVHSVDTRDGDSLVASSNVSATGKGDITFRCDK